MEEEIKENKKEVNKPNIWKILTIAFGIMLIISWLNLFGASKTQAKENVEKYLSSLPLEGEVIVGEVTRDSGLYKVTINVAGQDIESFVSKDGNILFTQAIDLSTPPITSATTVETQEDWSVFEEMPEDIKSQILNFETEEPEEYEENILEFKNYELIPDSLIVFYNPGCGWCGRYYPVILEAKNKYPELTIYALDSSQFQNIADKYSITGTPANIINGKYKVSGYMPIEDLTEILDKLE